MDSYNRFTVNILGVNYDIIMGDAEHLPELIKNELQGLTKYYEKEIYILTENMDKDFQMSAKANGRMITETITHELYHAYLMESGSKFVGEVQEEICMTFEGLHDKISESIKDIIRSYGSEK